MIQGDHQVWDLWYPDAAAQGLPFARGRLDSTDVLLVHAAPADSMWWYAMMTVRCWRKAPGWRARRSGRWRG